MRAELKRLHSEFKTTIVFVTHDQWEAMTLATTIAVMSEGRLQQVGKPEEIYDRPANRFVAQFVGNPPINVLEIASKPTSDLAARLKAYFAERHSPIDDIGSVGIRPESLGLAGLAEPVPVGAFTGPARVTGILPTGGSWILELTSGGDRVFLTTHRRPEIDLGKEVAFFVEAKSFHIFDGTGGRSTKADRVLAPAMHPL